MIPMGYMAKRVSPPPGFVTPETPDGLIDVYSVSHCVNDDFVDFVDFWKHNGYCFFDSPDIIADLASSNDLDLKGTRLFYYEAHELEYTGKEWRTFGPWIGWPDVNVIPPSESDLEGFDVVTFRPENSSQPLCSPLSCNNLAAEIPTNLHCLLQSFDEAKDALDHGKFEDGEQGPYRIFAVYSVGLTWPPEPLGAESRRV